MNEDLGNNPNRFQDANELSLEDDSYLDDQRVDELVRLHEQVADGNVDSGEQSGSARRLIEMLATMKPVTQGDTTRFIKSLLDTPVIGTETESEDEQLPRKIGRFEIKSVLGHGGFGIVFLVNDPKLNRAVALKTPRLAAILDDQGRERFAREGRSLAALNHPNIVPVFEVGNDGPVAWIASEFIRGTNLSLQVSNAGVYVPLAAAETVSTLAAAVQHAHGRGIIHRDIKPSNVLIDEDNNSVLLTDFGLARDIVNEDQSITQSGSVIGTPAFAAPEQLRGEEVTVASDIYSLGAVLYFLLTGEAPFSSDSIAKTILEVQNQQPVAPEKTTPAVPRDLSAICLKCLEKRPADRYATAHDLQKDLERFCNGAPVRARSLPAWSRFFRWCLRNKLVASLALIATAALLTTLVSTSINLNRSERLRKEAVDARARAESKAKQLTGAIERLFTAIVESPTALSNSAPLREKLLQETDALYQQVLADDPGDDHSQVEQTRAIFRLALLKQAIGDTKKALELATFCREKADQFRPAGLIEDSEFLEWRVFEAERLRELGRLDEADEKFVESLLAVGVAIDEGDFDQAVAMCEANPTLRQYIAVAISKRASAMTESGSLETADQLSQAALSIWSDLDAEIESSNLPDDADHENVLSPAVNHAYYKATCLAIRSNVLRQKGQFKDAEMFSTKAVGLWRGLAANALTNQLEPKRMLVESLSQLGIIVAEQQRLDEARDHYHDAMSIAEELVMEEPDVPRHGQLLTSVRYSLGVTEMLLENFEVAEKLILDNIERMEQLKEQSTEFQPHLNRSMANHFNLLCVIRQRSEESPELVREAIESAVDLHRQTIEKRPDLVGAHLDLSQALNNLAESFADSEELGSAIESTLDSIEHCEAIRKVRPEWPINLHHLGATQHALATLYFENEQHELALKHCDLAEELLPLEQVSEVEQLRAKIKKAREMQD
ncbi:serine/threonine protein kinase [Mariniblastus fucicola]|uniref:non-specific serine/threonine protein kinase n=1 Tax=Mariniblastus fucicola TaxID=980251 RepID=A0A5B9PSJ9_9BACT|nr:serine/threonine-protein kinase [Mariniblastus fucicola]QEG25203.1 Serine/threonine-protein kinase PknB [Mariniblastus fucicola]